MLRSRNAARSTAYTLVELLIVVVILGILAGLAVPYIDNESLEAKIVATQNTLRTMRTAIDLYRLRYTRPNYPPQILGSWFVGNKIPPNPIDPFGVTSGTVQVANTQGALDPAQKALTGSNAPFWYNVANGVLRARVPSQATLPLTEALYDRVNMLAPAGSTGVGGEVIELEGTEIGGLGGGSESLQVGL
ncbi:MAG: prepilin-type N-terminal cleavage/methylation domain-containing protein [Phycisphaerae bacterium]|nr:prepilin-type N-terminal cleavage/methylation domain-containing protein [Phycisphaerae bacterium]